MMILIKTPAQVSYGRIVGVSSREREIFIDNLLVRVHWIIEMIVVERPCALAV